ncbi:MAG: conjugative transposon protein TraM [Bacteroidales bacterium]|nr:conjugative transposon protein TraM [Bacteroidales bacterium]
MKKYAVFALMFVIFGGCIWFIFAPSAEERAKTAKTAGFNTDIPMPNEEEIIDNKKDAYVQGEMKRKQEEKMRSLQDFGELLGDHSQKPTADDLPPADETSATDGTQTRNTPVAHSPQSSIRKSADAYHDVHRTLDNFYQSPREDPEKEQIRQELEEVKARMNENEAKKNLKEEQMALMEKSFQMASKYLPANGGTPASTDAGTATSGNATSGKTTLVSVGRVTQRTASALPQNMSGAEFIAMYGQERNTDFFTATAAVSDETRNTVSACIHDDQTVMDGQSVRLRLLEPMQAGGTLIPRNAVITGQAKIGGERLGITVVSLEHAGTVIPVELRVYDADGQHGICVPHTQEMNAVKEIAASMGTGAGTSINLSSDATEQFVADMGRNLIQGTSQFAAKKLREVKVNLKAGYRVFLLPNDQ